MSRLVGVVVACALLSADLSVTAASARAVVSLGTATATTLASSTDPVAIGVTVTYTATVTPTPDGGTVSFTDDGASLCDLVAIDTAGVATCGASYGAPHVHQIVAMYSGDAAFDPSTSSPLNEMVVPTKLMYSGTRTLVLGFTVTPAALITHVAPSCLGGQQIAFGLDRNPITGAAGAYALETATTNVSGVATGAPISTSGWRVGAYVVTSTFAGSASCLAASDEQPFVVAARGDAAWGGGAYVVLGAGHISYAFRARRTGTNTYSGALVLINKDRWRLWAPITGFVKTGFGAGRATGAGALHWWKPSLNAGHGGWQLAKNGTSFTATFTATSGSQPATFGVQITFSPVPPQPSPLPVSASVASLQGVIRVV